MSLCLWIPLRVAGKLTVESQPLSLALASVRYVRAASIVLRPFANWMRADLELAWALLLVGQKHRPLKRL